MGSRTAGLEARISLTREELEATAAELIQQRKANAEAGQQIARLQATLEHERHAAEEKLALVDRAGQELREAFQALAADALSHNNQSFLQLAKASLERFQSEGRSDLEAKQKAVETLVAPIKDSLNKVDAQIQQMEIERGRAYGNAHESGPVVNRDSKRFAGGDWQPGEGTAGTLGAGPMGRNPVEAGSRDGGDDGVLRFRRANSPSRPKTGGSVRTWW